MKTAKTVPATKFTNKQLREYAQHDLLGVGTAQAFTTPECKVHRSKDGHVFVQVWVLLPATLDPADVAAAALDPTK